MYIHYVLNLFMYYVCLYLGVFVLLRQEEDNKTFSQWVSGAVFQLHILDSLLWLVT